MRATDLELIERFTRHHAEEAFSELVQRHLGLVYSAALRQVRSPQLAEEVAQSTFIKLAGHAHRLASETVLTSWLYQVTRREAIDVVRREARRQLREQIGVEMNIMNANADEWTQIEPLLDDAMHALDDADRSAILLRFFENKSLQDVGQALGTTDDTARKRVNRAIERLREFFAKRGVTVGTGGLVGAISANAVQAAPAGLAVALSTAAFAGTSTFTGATATIGKATVMTTIQKTLLGAVLLAAVGTAMYEARQASTLRRQAITIQQQHAALAEHLINERDEAIRQLATRQSIAERDSNMSELLKLRGEVTRLRRDTQESARSNGNPIQPPNKSPKVAAIIVTNLEPHVISEDQIRATIQTKVGDIHTRGAIDQDVRSLYGTGLFSNIRVEENSNELGITLTYILKEKSDGIAFGAQLRDMGARTPEQAATSLIWAASAGQEARVSELLELPKGVPEDDVPSHYKFFTKQLSNVFNTMEFLSVQGTRPNPDGTLRMNLSYRDIATGKTNPFPFMLRRHESAWKVVVEGNPPSELRGER